MKWLLSVFSLAIALNASASDKKLGNLIAVERTIENVFETCIDQIKKQNGENPPGAFFGCSIKVATAVGESAPQPQTLLRARDGDCNVDADVLNSKAIIMFNSESAKASFTSAMGCLRSALDKSPNKNSFKIMVYTLE